MSEDGRGKAGDAIESDADSLLRAIAHAPDRQPDGPDPARVAHFRILGRLGEGGMGVVYRAEDETLRRTVALKLLSATGGEAETRQRFLREARSAASITHPNVAIVYQVGEDEGRPYIAMELIEGESLRSRMTRGRLDVATTRELATQMARGLSAAHEKGIVHRDLKPENVMITSAGVVKLLDFGLAKQGVERVPSGPTNVGLARTETLVTSDKGRVMGTAEYMSPEQATGDALDVRSDVFSFGTVLYEMVSGRRPFQGTTTAAVIMAIVREAAPPLRGVVPGVDEKTEAVVMRCLAKEPGERFADAGEIVAALEPKRGEATIRSLADVVPMPRSGTGRRRPGTVSIAAVVLTVAVLAGVGGWRWSPLGAARSVAASASPRSSARAAVTSADGPSRSSNAEAQRFFDEAMRSFHDGTWQTVPLLQSAVKADPSFGGAYLRLWWLARQTTQAHEHADEYHLRVVALQDKLAPADRALLDYPDRPRQPGYAAETRGRRRRQHERDTLRRGRARWWRERSALGHLGVERCDVDAAPGQRPPLAPASLRSRTPGCWMSWCGRSST